jgi:protein-tyrosine-phosphatase
VPDHTSRVLPGAVLFACNVNRVRSPMAEGVLKLIWGDRIFVDSCGVRPTGDLDPFAVQVMEEIGADLTRHHAKSFDDLDASAFDLVVSLTPEAQHRAVEMTRGAAVDIEYWPTLDPTLASGSREQVLDQYRQVREALRTRILARFGKPSTFGG